jgi:hypothetical protein
MFFNKLQSYEIASYKIEIAWSLWRGGYNIRL